jgi:hypothetical protein
MPASLLHSEQEIEQLVMRDAQAQQQQEMAAQVPEMARAAKDLQSANLMPEDATLQ